MSIQITGRKIEVTDFMKIYIQDIIQGLYKYHLNINTIHVIVENNKKTIKVEFIINIQGQNKFVIKSSDKDFYTATANTYEISEKTLRRLHDKLVSQKKQTEKINF